MPETRETGSLSTSRQEAAARPQSKPDHGTKPHPVPGGPRPLGPHGPSQRPPEGGGTSPTALSPGASVVRAPLEDVTVQKVRGLYI